MSMDPMSYNHLMCHTPAQTVPDMQHMHQMMMEMHHTLMNLNRMCMEMHHMMMEMHHSMDHVPHPKHKC